MIKNDTWFVTGSWALKAYNLLKDRDPSDLDFLSDQPKMVKRKSGLQVEHSSCHDLTEKTNQILWQYCQQHKTHSVTTPLGEFWVAPLEVLKVMKLASLPLSKAKHSWDLQVLKNVVLSSELEHIAQLRYQETLARIEKSKFFNKYPIPRYIVHDELHQYITPTPAYKKILNNTVEISEQKFNELTLEEKYLELFEESFVLALERELIPAYKAYPFLLKDYLGEFRDSRRSNTAARRWLSRLATPGLVKDRPDWIALWGQTNYSNYEMYFDAWWQQTFDNLSVEFWRHFIQVKDLDPLSE